MCSQCSLHCSRYLLWKQFLHPDENVVFCSSNPICSTLWKYAFKAFLDLPTTCSQPLFQSPFFLFLLFLIHFRISSFPESTLPGFQRPITGDDYRKPAVGRGFQQTTLLPFQFSLLRSEMETSHFSSTRMGVKLDCVLQLCESPKTMKLGIFSLICKPIRS